MSSIHLPQTIRLNVMRSASAFHVKQPSLTEKIQNVSRDAFENLKVFYGCMKQNFKPTLIISILNVRVGFSFKILPVKYRIFIAATLSLITNLFFSVILYAKTPARVKPQGDHSLAFTKSLFSQADIEAIKDNFSQRLEAISANIDTVSFKESLTALKHSTQTIKDELYDIVRTNGLRVLGSDCKVAFRAFFSENFTTFCEAEVAKATIELHIKTNLEHTLLRFLNPQINKATLSKPLPVKAADKDVPDSVSFDTLFTFFDAIDWNNPASPHYISKYSQPEAVNLYTFQLRNGIQAALDKVHARTPTPVTPPAGTKEFNKWFDDIEFQLRACIWHIQKQEMEVNELMAGRSYEEVDEETQKAYKHLCENKGRLAFQIAVSGHYCAKRTKDETAQMYKQFYPFVTIDDANTLSLDELLVKYLAQLRLNTANAEIYKFRPDPHDNSVNVHFQGAYMESLGTDFNIPDETNQTENYTKFDEASINRYAQSYAESYTPEAMIQEIQKQYKEKKAQGFREKVQQWLEDKSEGWNHDKYNRIYVNVQGEINDKLEELEDVSIKEHPDSNFFISLLKAAKPQTQIVIDEESDAKISLTDFVLRVKNHEASFDKLLNELFSLEELQHAILAEANKGPKKHLALVKLEMKQRIKALKCENALVDLAEALLKKDHALEGQALNALSDALTTTHKVSAVRKIVLAQGLSGVDCTLYDKIDDFAASLKAAVRNLQKADYLQERLGDQSEANDDEAEINIDAEVVKELLVHYEHLHDEPEIDDWF